MADKELQIILKARDEASSVFRSFADNVSTFSDPIVEGFKAITNEANDFTKMISGVITDAQKSIATVTEPVKDVIEAYTAMKDAVGEAISVAFSPVSAAVSAVSTGFSAIESAAETMASVVSTALTAMTGGFSFIITTFVDFGSAIANSLDTALTAIKELPLTIAGWGETVMSPLNFFADGIFNVEKAANQFLSGSFFKLAAQGGEFAESFGRASDVALAYGQDLTSIEAAIDKFGDGALNAAERMTLASKSIKSGLTGPDMDLVLEYSHKIAETTGQDFEAAASKIFKAFESGKFDSLQKGFGIVVEKGDSAADIMGKLADKSAALGEDVFNSADNIKAMSTDIKDWVTYIGDAINSNEAWQRVLTAMTDAVDEFVKNFDYQTVGTFFGNIVHAGEVMYNALVQTFSGTLSYIRDTFKAIGTQAGSQEVFTGLVDAALATSKGVVKSFQSMANMILPVAGSITGGIITGFGTFFRFVEGGAISAASSFAGYFQNAVITVTQMMNDLANSNAGVALGLNTDELSAAIDRMQQGAVDLNVKLYGAKVEFQKKGTSGIGEAIEEAGQKVAAFSKQIKFDFADRFTTIADEVKKNMGKFELPPLEPVKQMDLNKARQAAAAIAQAKEDALDEAAAKAQAKEEKKALAAAKKATDEAKRLLDERKKALKEAEDQEEKAHDQQKASLERRLKEITTTIERNTPKKGVIYQTFMTEIGYDEYALKAEQDKISKVLAEFDKQENAKARLGIADILKNDNAAKMAADLAKETQRILDAAKKGNKLDLRIDIDDATKKLLNGESAESLKIKADEAAIKKMYADIKSKNIQVGIDATEEDRAFIDKLNKSAGKADVSIRADLETKALLSAQKSGKIDVTHTQKDSRLQVTIPGLQWPPVLQELVKLIIGEITQQLRTERIPLVLTTLPA